MATPPFPALPHRGEGWVFYSSYFVAFVGQCFEHGFGDEDDAALADAEALFVQFAINADLQAIRDGLVAVGDAAA